MAIDAATPWQLTPPGDTDCEDGTDSAADPVPGARAGDDPSRPMRHRDPALRWAALAGLAVIVALATLVSWLGFRAHQAHQQRSEQGEFLEAARQGALNLTTIDWQHADTDVRRIVDGATGDFYNEFSDRAQPFIDVVKQAQSTSVGTVTDTGLESQTPDAAQALVAVSVKTSTPGAAQQDPRTWRMRISMQKVDGHIKVSNVEFVP